MPGQDLLDVGCGPGTITIDLARIVAPGRVVGVDRAEAPLATARTDAATAGVAVDFEVGDAYALAFPDDSFDVVHAHQLLQHLGRPVAALAEMRRVCRPDGIVAARDSDYAAMTWYPDDPLLDRWLSIYREVARANGGEPDAGRRLLAWGRAAGFAEVVPSASVWCFATAADRAWWGGLWADRVTASAFAEQAVERGVSDAGRAGPDRGRVADAGRPSRTAGSACSTARSSAAADPRVGLVAVGAAGSLVLGRSRLVARARRTRRGAGRHVGSLLLGAAGAGHGDGLGERLGGGRRQAAHPGRLDLLDPLGLGAAPLALELGMPRHDPSFRGHRHGVRSRSVPEVGRGTSPTLVAYPSTVSLYTLVDGHDLIAPTLLAAFDGWVDAGSAATTALGILADDGDVVARVRRRPAVRLPGAPSAARDRRRTAHRR